MASQGVKELRLEPGAGAAGVELGEKRVLGVVEDDCRIESSPKLIGERGFADAKRAFDRDVPEVHGEASITGRSRTSGRATRERQCLR